MSDILKTDCPSCKRTLVIKPEFAGRKLKCPHCGTIIQMQPSEPVLATNVQSFQPLPASHPYQARADESAVAGLASNAPKNKNGLLLLVAGVLIGGAFAICAVCGGLFFLGGMEFERQAEVAMERNAVVQQYIGKDVDAEMDMGQSESLSGAEEFCFQVKGPLGEGELYGNFVTVSLDEEEISYGMLKLSTGETYNLNTGEEIDGENVQVAMLKLELELEEGL